MLPPAVVRLAEEGNEASEQGGRWPDTARRGLESGPIGMEAPPALGASGAEGWAAAAWFLSSPPCPTRHRTPASVCPLSLVSSDFLLFSRHRASTRLKRFLGMNASTLLRNPGGGALV